MMAAFNNISLIDPDDQDPTGSEKEPPCFSPLFPDLSSTSPSNEALTNAQMILLGSQAIQTLLTGRPDPESYDIPDLIAAMRWLWAFHGLATLADTKAEFIEMMGFLMMD